LVTVVVVVIWQSFATWRTRAVLTREREYQRMAEASTAAQEQVSLQLEGLSGELTERPGGG
jgi:hypothetical protein